MKCRAQARPKKSKLGIMLYLEINVMYLRNKTTLEHSRNQLVYRLSEATLSLHCCLAYISSSG